MINRREFIISFSEVWGRRCLKATRCSLLLIRPPKNPQTLKSPMFSTRTFHWTYGNQDPPPLARKKPMRSAKPSVSQEGPAGPQLTQYKGFGSPDPGCGGSWHTCSGRRSCPDRPASRSVPILSRARSPAGGTAVHRAEQGLGFRRVSKPCSPYLLGPGVIFCLDLKLAVLRVAAVGLGRRTPALPEPLLLLPLGHGSSGPRCGCSKCRSA